MKKLIGIAFICAMSLSSLAQGIQFEHTTYENVLKKAKKQKKLVFLDFYTSWCGPCQHMIKEVFPKKSVGDFYNENFINYKINAQKEEGPEIAKKFNVSAYPTCIFIDDEGNVIYKFLGGKDEKSLIQQGENALQAYKGQGRLARLQKKYDKGARDKDFLYKLFEVKSYNGLECGTILNEYLSLLSKDELTAEQNWENLKKITIYNEPVIDILVEKLIAMYTSKQDVKDFEKCVFTALGTCISNTTKNNEESNFDKLIAYKEELSKYKSNTNIINAGMGGGSFYMSTDYMKLQFYQYNKCDLKYKKTTIAFYENLQEEYKKNQANADSLSKVFDEKIRISEQNNEDVSMLKKMKGMLTAFSAVSDKVYGDELLKAGKRYYELTDNKTLTLNKFIKDCVVLAYQLDPTPSLIIDGSDLLIECGYKDLAIALLKDVRNFTKDNKMVEEADLKKAEEKLQQIK